MMMILNTPNQHDYHYFALVFLLVLCCLVIGYLLLLLFVYRFG